MILRLVLALASCVSLSSAVRSLSWPLNCSQQGLMCTVNINNCMDREWLKVHGYTPSSPEGLRVSVDTRQDETGHLQPVLVANWNIKDDGSVYNLRATELHVLAVSTNENVCVRYSFKGKLQMRNPSGGKWSFSANMLVLDPGQMYQVSVFNIPKPELNHTNYEVSSKVTVPDCPDPKMKMTNFCIERGSLWQPGIAAVRVGSELVVSFTPDTLCEEYMVIVRCITQHVSHTYKGNQTILNATFRLDKWPRTCCQFDVEIKPLFQKCGQDCARQRTTVDICGIIPDAPGVPGYKFVVLGMVLVCVVMTVTLYFLCRKPGTPGVDAAPVGGEIQQQHHQKQLQQPPTVLVIYSQDHQLYRDVVLKLCAFLQAKCGTKVLVDLLDSTSVGIVGPIRWLEWQRQQLKNPSDKILVLCSQGVQAKWRAMCGQGRVKLREDILSPSDDMLTPFLNLFLPDMHQTGMLGKYMVAYFDDISREQDVPSVFDIAVKYKLMKHFEELYFRIVDIEKYQPGQVCHIKGIGGDDYFDCPSGRALKNAIETFQAYQLENPDWFEKECVDSEEEVKADANLLIEQLQIPPILEYIPLIREGLPVFTHDVEINENGHGVHVLTPELNPERKLSSVLEVTPVVNLPNLEVLTGHLYPHCPIRPVYIDEPVLNNRQTPRQNWLSLEEEPFGQIPTEDEEEDLLLPMSQLCFPPSEINPSQQPVEMEEIEVLEPRGTGPTSGSDQGYISKISSQHESPFKEDALVALRRLQEELFHPGYLDPEAN